jgi:hypothetical protein
MNEVRRARSGTVARGRVRSRRPGSGRRNLARLRAPWDPITGRTGSGPANLATIRAAVIAALKDAGYLHIPEGRRDHTTPAETLRLHGLD